MLINDVKYDNENKEIILKIFFILKSIKLYGNKKTIIYTTSIDDSNKYLNALY